MILWNDKDGGPESRVWCWGFELKWLGSVLLLKFGAGSREAFHTHAFNAVSWVLWGSLSEIVRSNGVDPSPLLFRHYVPGWLPVFTYRHTFHMVEGIGTSWVLTFRGPWVDNWREYLPKVARHIRLTHGRKELQ